MLYVTLPVVLRQQAHVLGRDDRFDFYLANAEIAYGRSLSGVQEKLGKVRDGALDIETYGAAMLRLALAGRNYTPWVIFDCRSKPAIGGPAPSYKLAAKAGLRTASPVMLSGQGGIEAVQAMQFFAGSAKTGMGAIVSSSWEVSRHADAPRWTSASACLIDRLPFTGCRFLIHGIGQARDARDVGTAIEFAVADAVRKGGTSAPTWIAVSPTWTAIEPWAHRLPTASILDSESARHPDINLPDPLLALTRCDQAIPGTEPGLLVCLGSTGAIGALVVSICDQGASS